jgi:hypothetical protein
MHENIRLFDEVIRASGAKAALYLTWARRHAPETQAAITNAYTSIGRELGATIVPAGVAWERFLSRHESPVLHDKDGSHPTLAGSYLAAAVFCAVLFGEDSLESLPAVDGLEAREARVLEQVVGETLGAFSV